jgi:hypothetical protein
MNGAFAADSLHSESDLVLANGAVFKSDVSLNGANIDGFVNMIGASFGSTLDADKLQVGSGLFMYSDAQNKASFKDVVLRGAKIAGQINMVGASFGGKLNADARTSVACCSCDPRSASSWDPTPSTKSASRT